MLQLFTDHLVEHGSDIVREDGGDLYAEVTRFMEASDAGGLVLLGAFGSGKTLLCNSFQKRHRSCTAVPLRIVARAPSVGEGLKKVIGPVRLVEAQEGQRLLFLDGFDEIPPPSQGYAAFFGELISVVGPRWVMTSRPSHFRTEGPAAPNQVDPFAFDSVGVRVIRPLTRGQVRDVIGALEDGQALMRSVEGLEDLATSPVLLHAVDGARPWIERDRPIFPWGVFDGWIRHGLAGGNDGVMACLEDLCWQSFLAAGATIEVTHLDARLLKRAKLPGTVTRGLLVTDLDGHVRFGHRSIYEFLLAASIAPRLAGNQGKGPDALSGMRLTEAMRAFIVGRVPPMAVEVEARRTRIPRGNFIAGGERAYDERPLRIAHLETPFWIARSPVTHAEWAHYLSINPDMRVDVNYLSHWGPDRTMPEGSETQPIYGLWPEDADQFAQWSSARLPTANEWEKAVRGIDGRRFPWGDTWSRGRSVTAELGLDKPLPVQALGAHGVSALFSATGGVFEYTADRYGDQENRGRVVMGGCYTHPHATSRASLRLSHKLSGNLKTGVRLAWDCQG